jgi:hypothetical protein
MIIEELGSTIPLNRNNGDEELHAINTSERTPMIIVFKEMSSLPKKQICTRK